MAAYFAEYAAWVCVSWLSQCAGAAVSDNVVSLGDTVLQKLRRLFQAMHKERL
jgi:hypothetical protein